MDRKFKLAIIARVERHPEIWNFTSEDYKKQEVRMTAWEQIVSELQAEGYETVTGPDDEEFASDVKNESQFIREGSVTTEDGYTDTSGASVASPSCSSVNYGHAKSALRRNTTSSKQREQVRADNETPRVNAQTGAERTTNAPDRFDILGQYIAQTLRELSPEVSSMKILEITKVLHATSTTPNSKSSKTPQQIRK
ncbi:unnamed protein product [Nippostrongylus brasiliensis]|uniref:MADF domain-containing protein n=1 Tax=Nippostrongylus brasiliensis TaxID=27835 RepID=A0A0N4YXC9_NIPBR|nr:unnamed protein product [Nippostrongylus brasiliensis]